MKRERTAVTRRTLLALMVSAAGGAAVLIARLPRRRARADVRRRPPRWIGHT
jgi:hypothetical protein